MSYGPKRRQILFLSELLSYTRVNIDLQDNRHIVTSM